MRRSTVPLIVLVTVLALIAPTAWAGKLETGNYSADLPEASAQGEVEAPAAVPGDASAGGELTAGDGNLSVQGPGCEGSARQVNGSCHLGSAEFTAPGVLVQPEAHVRLPLQFLFDGSGSTHTTQGWTTAPSNQLPDGTAWTMLLAAGGAAALVLLARFLLSLGGALPLSTRMGRTEVLEEPTRERIVELLRERPGLSTKQVQERLDLAWGTLTYHLRILEDHRHVVSRRYGRYRRHFVNGHADPAEQDLLAALRHPSTAQVAEAIQDAPGANQTEVGESLGVTAGTVVYHVERLLEVDAVEKVREGRSVAYYPTKRLRSVTR